MAGKDNDVGADIRMSALLVSALVKASDDELASFLHKRQSLEIDELKLKRVRDLIRELAQLLKQPSDVRWEDVESAYVAIVGGDTQEAADPIEDETSVADDDGAAAIEVRAVHPSIDRPPVLGELLGAPDPPPASARSYPPSPWVEPSRAHENKRKSAIVPPPAEPLPPPMVVPPIAEERVDEPVAEIVDETSHAGSTVIPPPMESEAPAAGSPLPMPSSPPPAVEAPKAAHVGQSAGVPPVDASPLAASSVATASSAPPPAAPPPRHGGPETSQAGDTQPPFDEDDEEETDKREPRTKTLPPVAMNDEALPFQAAPLQPDAPSIQDWPPEALASVITGLPPMTLVSYAALTASCDALPMRVGETHAKFGITDSAARRSLDAAWKATLDEDPRLLALWSTLHQQFKSWLTLLF